MSDKKETAIDKIKLEIEKIKSLAQDKADKNSDRPMSEAVIEAEACIDVCNHLLSIIPQSKEIEKQKEYETKCFWYGRGILAHKENKIKELKPIFNNTNKIK